MRAVSLMAIALGQELQARGIFSIDRGECEAIIASVVGGLAAVANEALLAKPRLALAIEPKHPSLG